MKKIISKEPQKKLTTGKKTVKKIVKKSLTTHESFIQSMTPTQKKKYDLGYQEFLISELLIAIMKDDAISVRELAKAAGISPAVIQGVRSGDKPNITTQNFFKILQALGCSLIIKKDNHQFPIELFKP